MAIIGFFVPNKMLISSLWAWFWQYMPSVTADETSNSTTNTSSPADEGGSSNSTALISTHARLSLLHDSFGVKGSESKILGSTTLRKKLVIPQGAWFQSSNQQSLSSAKVSPLNLLLKPRAKGVGRPGNGGGGGGSSSSSGEMHAL